MKHFLIVLIALALPAFQALQAQAALTKNDQKTLIYLAEEEKMAFDFYQAMEAKWGAKVFNHIAEAEQRHLGRIVGLAASHSVDLPGNLTADKAGKFQSKELRKLYKELIASGEQSLEKALLAGAQVEEADIRDLKQALESTQEEALRSTYKDLLDASGNHLRAFNKKLAAQGVTYSPVLLPQADFNAIVTAEDGEQGCQGKKAQAGKGCCQKKGAKQGQCCKGKGKGDGKCKGKGRAGSH